MKRERLFYLDFIRALATILIIITHYNALYLYLPEPTPEKAFITTEVFNIYIGDLGSALFFIISGAALMHVYENECNLKKYYKKRFLSIFPMFWMTFVIDFLFRCYLDGGINPTIPKWKIIFSIIGMDGYLEEIVHAFFCVGEWFLGCIILMYIIFPLLRWLIEKKPVILVICTGLLYVITLLTDGKVFPLGKNMFVHLPKFVFGMFFVRYIKKVNIPMFMSSILIVLLNSLIDLKSVSSIIQALYIGIATFLILIFLSKHIECQPIRYISSVISKYSYAIFLVHHVIILRLTSKIDLVNITKTNSYLLFFFCVLCIAFVSKMIYVLHEKMMESIKWMFKKE